MSAPRLWFTSMSGPGEVENITELLEPILPFLDGVVWVLHDCPADDPGARYLERVKGAGRVIHRGWPAGRHWHSMNDTLFTGLMDEGDYVLWADALERPATQFVSRIKEEIGPLMKEAERQVLVYHGKPYLFLYSETLEYRNSPHWTLTGWQGHIIDWTSIEPDEGRVRLNVRPIKRRDPLGWVLHFARYWLYPAGSNHAAMGLDHWPGENTQANRNAQFVQRETRRLAFRRLMRARGLPLTMEGLKQFLTGPLDNELRHHLVAEKVLSDVWHYWNGDRSQLRDSHNPAHALPIP